MIITLSLVAFFVSLFVLYSMARHDFVLLRQNISVRYIFDKAFLILFIAFIFSRLIFIIDNGALDLLSPLKFLHVIRFGGMVLLGGYLVSLVTAFLLFRKRKSKARILDIYFLSFYPFILLDIATSAGEGMVFLIAKVFMFATAVGIYVFFFILHKSYSVKDGVLTTGVVAVISFSTTLLVLFAQKAFFSLQLVTIIGSISFAAAIAAAIYIQKNKFIRK